MARARERALRRPAQVNDEATTIVRSDGRMVEIGPIDPATLTALADAEETAKAAMDQAGNDLVAARMAHRNLTRAASR